MAGAAHVSIVNRTPERGQAVAELVTRHASAGRVRPFDR